MSTTNLNALRQPGRRELLVSKGWLQAVAMVVLFGFFVMGLLAYRTYAGEAPIPEQVLSPEGQVLSWRRLDADSGDSGVDRFVNRG